MQLIRGIHNIQAQHHGCVLSIGNFDGVHLGHQQVLQHLVVKAKQLGLPSLVMLFEPQPLEFFAPDKAPARLCTFREKYQLLKSLGIDRVLCIRFNQRFSDMNASAFMSTLLAKKLGVRYLVVGDDFRFGKAREGDFAALQLAKSKLGFELSATQSFCVANQRVSSTQIRAGLESSDFESAQQQLGRAYAIHGTVVHGRKLGRQLGFPTANIRLNRTRSPLHGVFAVQVSSEDHPEQVWNAVANLGWRPSAGGTELLLEAHLFDFTGSLYSQRLQIVPRLKIRGEQKFDSLEALTQQVENDIQQAKEYFSLATFQSGTIEQ
ncbi:bifunctional riboflavin kinase/FAD synthetase [Alginatibacterium sediminis]|uniref:Riboflavin biosynthesis protein n=1 Tax=Alginatibacterium sediminis TaxID=2164068 RepID=A0A420EJS8_9ALTE|nr:bifunctional riboflavin kinase/FAD synthetase [Alginatibacterium sediminis]RKF20918.1 bifunctional riboflavin kinase/FAD synthetase [Alginatibacterium sediminis]